MPEELKSGDNTLGSVLGKEMSGTAVDVSARVERVDGVDTTREQGQESEVNQLSEILSKAGSVGNSVLPSGNVTDDARNLSLLSDAESQVTRLLDLAVQKGIPHAVDVARKMKDYYLLDRMHDDMVDKFYQGLVDKGLVDKG